MLKVVCKSYCDSADSRLETINIERRALSLPCDMTTQFPITDHGVQDMSDVDRRLRPKRFSTLTP